MAGKTAGFLVMVEELTPDLSRVRLIHTSVVAHPDGDLGAYLGSLDRLHRLAEAHEIASVWPGHGPVVEDALAVLTHYRAHRHERLHQVREALRSLDETVLRPAAPSRRAPDDPDLVRSVVEIVYADVDPVLWGAAELSVRAQLAYLAR